jgi:predicted aminopeptidase
LVSCASSAPTTTPDAPAIDAAWLVEQGIGQAEVLYAARPVLPIIRDVNVHVDLRRRLAVAVIARRFAKERLALNVTNQYRSAVFLTAPAIVYVVSAAPKDALVPYLWRYPVVGALPYRGHFSLEDAEGEADRLEGQGLDVSVRPVTVYSLLGLAPDPIVSSMLYRRDELDVIETVIHELAHATVFAADAGAFNEGLATFIGKEGRRQLVRERFGAGSAVAARVVADDEDADAYARATAALAFDLRVLYAQSATRDAQSIVDEKQRIFARHQAHWQSEVATTLHSYRLRSARLPENNAALAAVGIYSLKQQLYARAFESCGGDWRCFVSLLRRVAADDDPETRLAEHVGSAPRDLDLLGPTP